MTQTIGGRRPQESRFGGRILARLVTVVAGARHPHRRCTGVSIKDFSSDSSRFGRLLKKSIAPHISRLPRRLRRHPTLLVHKRWRFLGFVVRGGAAANGTSRIFV
jgi:hypothetical protein